eukprot:TRINITY_DN6853_c0_g1_i1.p1 TRINITY_DN6853_c0_g1~~TRINITY_DN6853_c0_g1_i1.p1  ORF type:complete len:425 (+),score=133.79 TRINITY_DN6853_c0_g1_i1:71-1276(+)
MKTVLFLAICLQLALCAHFGVYTLSMQSPNQLLIFKLETKTKSLVAAGSVNTGGDGTKAGTLSSQGALINTGNFLIGVNPSSNSVSLFSINRNDSSSVKLVGTASSNGEWPVSVTAFGNKACVVNGGAKDGIQCYTFSETGLVPIAGANVTFGFGLTTPPTNPQGPAQISFTADGKGLIVSNKQMANGVASIPIMMYTFDGTTIGSTRYAAPAQGNVPFGFTVDGDGDVVLTDANPYKAGLSGVQLLSVATTGTPSISWSLPAYMNLTGEKDACWAIWSAVTKHYYIANAGSASISELSKNMTTLALVRTIKMDGDPLDMALVTNDGTDHLLSLAKDHKIYSWVLNMNAPTAISSVATGSTLSNGCAAFRPDNANEEPADIPSSASLKAFALLFVTLLFAL